MDLQTRVGSDTFGQIQRFGVRMWTESIALKSQTLIIIIFQLFQQFGPKLSNKTCNHMKKNLKVSYSFVSFRRYKFNFFQIYIKTWFLITDCHFSSKKQKANLYLCFFVRNAVRNKCQLLYLLHWLCGKTISFQFLFYLTVLRSKPTGAVLLTYFLSPLYVERG